MNKITVTMIGAGNVAWHLAPALDNAGIVVKQVYSRSKKKARELTSRLYQAEATDSLDFSKSTSELFLVAVSDAAIESVAREIILPDYAIIAHTSATMPVSSLEFAGTSRMGVFYPLQTFTQNKKIDFRQVPLLLESTDKQTSRALLHVAESISDEVWEIEEDKRLALHVAAVFANNFSNHMVKIAEDIVQANGLSLSMLLPLLQETCRKIIAIGPEAAQTGPARRGDMVTINRHLDHLRDSGPLLDLYASLSRHIQETYEEEYEE
jgi:predicted short-subunit dehydrogenase-like oxidoreductase (DUF2520 family)